MRAHSNGGGNVPYSKLSYISSSPQLAPAWSPGLLFLSCCAGCLMPRLLFMVGISGGLQRATGEWKDRRGTGVKRIGFDAWSIGRKRPFRWNDISKEYSVLRFASPQTPKQQLAVNGCLCKLPHSRGGARVISFLTCSLLDIPFLMTPISWDFQSFTTLGYWPPCRAIFNARYWSVFFSHNGSPAFRFTTKVLIVFVQAIGLAATQQEKGAIYWWVFFRLRMV